MFSLGQLIFGFLFFITFSIVLFFAYKKDKKDQKEYFKGSFKIILFMVGLIFSLFLIKICTHK